ncbi:MAG: hypothetical protein J6Z01_09910 [Bacteroidales bacterium]|nr:hypothetical protein [Bacteroidales bacterium]
MAYINEGNPIYITYARNDAKHPGWKHISDVVDLIIEKFTEEKIHYKIDTEDIEAGDSITAFEKEIGAKPYTILVYSDKYFHSWHCMFELSEIKKNIDKKKGFIYINADKTELNDRYIPKLEKYWDKCESDLKRIKRHRSRDLTGIEIAADEHNFYVDDVLGLKTFFSEKKRLNAENLINNSAELDSLIKTIKKWFGVKTIYSHDENGQNIIPSTGKLENHTTDKQKISALKSQIDVKKSEKTKKTKIVGGISAVGLLIGILIMFLLKPWPEPLGETTTEPDTLMVTDTVKIRPIDTIGPPQQDTTGVIVPEYVDLGISVLWATCNIGADNPWDYGDYFAWGETKPKDDYSWDNYEFCEYVCEYNIEEDDDQEFVYGLNVFPDNHTLLKYCNDTTYCDNEVSDTLTQLQSSDDAAFVTLGNGWRMPTIGEFNELVNNCETEWVENYRGQGVNGYKFTGKNGNHIFLPAAGSTSDEFNEEDADGSYWSSSLGSHRPYCAQSLSFNYRVIKTDLYDKRCDGLSVRPVRPKK